MARSGTRGCAPNRRDDLGVRGFGIAEAFMRPADNFGLERHMTHPDSGRHAVTRDRADFCGDRRRTGDYLAARLIASGRFDVPAPLSQESRAPDSIQFSLNGLDAEDHAVEFQRLAVERSVQVQIFARSRDNARAFWNWGFLGPQPGLSPTREILQRTCDVRLPVHLEKTELDAIAEALVDAARTAASAKSPACRQEAPGSGAERVSA